MFPEAAWSNSKFARLGCFRLLATGAEHVTARAYLKGLTKRPASRRGLYRQFLNVIWASSSRAEAKTKQNNNNSENAGSGHSAATRIAVRMLDPATLRPAR